MKRRFLVVLSIFISLINLYAVYAQETEEKILGMSISALLVMIPVGMIVLGLLFFLGLYFKDHYKKIVNSIKNVFTRKRKFKEITKKATDYSKELQALQKRLPVLEPEEAIQHLSSLVKRFFAEKINLDYEFTHKELAGELEKVNPNWASLPKRIDYVKYSGEPLTKKDVNDLIKEFWNILKYERRRKISATVVEKLKKRRLILEIGVLKNLSRYLGRIKPEGEKLTSREVMSYFLKRQKQRFQVLSDFLRKLKTDAVNEIKTQLESISRLTGFFSGKITEKRIGNMLDLLEDIRKQIIKGRMDQAKIKYKQAYQLYYKLPVEEQAHIITELQELQQKIRESKPKFETKESPIEKIKKFFQQKLTVQTINKVDNLIREIQKQIDVNDLQKAKDIYKQAYQLYYRLPIDEQERILFQLRKMKDRMIEIEKNKERLELEELSKELVNLKSEEEVYIIFDKGNISKKLGSLTNYIQKVGEQEIHGLESGKEHIKEKLKDLVETAEKVEQEDKKNLTTKEKKYLIKIKSIGRFFSRKEADLEKTFEHTQKQVFDKIHDITQQVKAPPKPEEPPAYAKKPVKAELVPPKPPVPILIPGLTKEIGTPADVERLLLYLGNKKEQGLYDLKPTGKEFLDKIGSMVRSIKQSKQTGITLKDHEKEFLDSMKLFLKKDKEMYMPSIEEEKRMLKFLEHMKEKEMVHLDEQKLQKEKEKFVKPVMKLPKTKIDVRKLRKLHEAEERVMGAIQKIPQTTYPQPVRKIHERPIKRHEWEAIAEEVKKRKTKAMMDLLKEEQDIQAKLKELR